MRHVREKLSFQRVSLFGLFGFAGVIFFTQSTPREQPISE